MTSRRLADYQNELNQREKVQLSDKPAAALGLKFVVGAAVVFAIVGWIWRLW